MSLALVREYISLIDDQKGNPGHVMPCDIYKHLITTGMDQQRAALTTGLITVLGGFSTNPTFPLISKAAGPQRDLVQIPQDVDPLEVLKQGGKGMLQQVMAIAEALIIPPVSRGMERRIPVKKSRSKDKATKTSKGLFKVFDMVVQNKGVLQQVLGPLLQGLLKT
jgi:hypothetical protein